MRPAVDLENKRVLVVGLARTGVAAALFCFAHGAHVAATDERNEEQFEGGLARLREQGISVQLGGHQGVSFLDQDLIVVSPGVPANLPGLQAARSHGLPVWSEIELAWRFLRGKLIAITGSNGKTTTTALLAHILQSAGIPVLVGGNIGTPLLSSVQQSTDSTVTVAEVSSFQLETIDQFRPEIGVLLNLTPDHLDRHETFEKYAEAKTRLFENQTESDAAILNADDPEVARRAPTRPKIYWFSREKPVANGTYLHDGQIILRDEDHEEPVMRRDEIPLRGEHNVENVMAGCLAAHLAGAPIPSLAGAVRTFPGVEHRLQFVRMVRGVSFYNDSKATNVDAALKAVVAFDSPLLVILGGKDKGAPYTPLAQPLRQRARAALLIGNASDKIGSDLADAVHLKSAGTLERAVSMAFESAHPGDVVLLAPACSSFDQFENYEQRGRVFMQLVDDLARRIDAQSHTQSHVHADPASDYGIKPRDASGGPVSASEEADKNPEKGGHAPNPPARS